jgi:Arc/MetJ-type ribon-helix-helix transcriptional regulator
MTIDLKPAQEQLVEEALQSGRYQNVDEFLDEALSAWKHDQPLSFNLQRAQAAAASIRELRVGLTLGGLTIKELVEEGRR